MYHDQNSVWESMFLVFRNLFYREFVISSVFVKAYYIKGKIIHRWFVLSSVCCSKKLSQETKNLVPARHFQMCIHMIFLFARSSVRTTFLENYYILSYWNFTRVFVILMHRELKEMVLSRHNFAQISIIMQNLCDFTSPQNICTYCFKMILEALP